MKSYIPNPDPLWWIEAMILLTFITLLALSMAGCSSNADGISAPSGADFRFRFVDTLPLERQEVLELWVKQRDCVKELTGKTPREPNAVWFQTHPGPEALDCGGPALACTKANAMGLVRIDVLRDYRGTRYFEANVQHEMIHVGLAQTGLSTDPCHRGPTWHACGVEMEATC